MPVDCLPHTGGDGQGARAFGQDIVMDGNDGFDVSGLVLLIEAELRSCMLRLYIGLEEVWWSDWLMCN